MVTFGTLDTIIDDILLELRNSNIAESEQLSRIQIEQWILQYRTVLIKQDIDKGRDINPDYIQDIENIELQIEDYTIDSIHGSSDKILVTKGRIPKTIDFHFRSGLTYIGDSAGNEIQLMSERRSSVQKFRRYTFYDYSAFVKGQRIYVNGPGDIRTINVRGIFENPASVSGFDVTKDTYPVPMNMIPVIKELIFTKEIKLQVPSDVTNDSSDDTQNAQKADRRYRENR